MIDPRCTHPAGSTCPALDRAHPPWDATIATWLSWGLVCLFVALLALWAGYCVLSLLLVMVNVIAPRDRSTSIRDRLGNSRWLYGATWCIGLVLIGCRIVAARWASFGLISSVIVAIVIVAIPSIMFVESAANRADAWARNYRFDQIREREVRLMRAAMAAQRDGGQEEGAVES